MVKTRHHLRTVARLRDRHLLALIRCAVREEMCDLLGDPDAGLQLRASTERRIERSQESLRRGKVYTESEIIRGLGLRV